MTAKTFEIQVQDDHLQRISQVRKPILAVAELIWNAVDADADHIDVVLHDDQLGGLKAVKVADNGHGIPCPDAEDLFSRLGGSWKQGGHRSYEKRRILHGKEGRGRFRAFALGRVVDWHVCSAANGRLLAYRIAMMKDYLKRVQVDDEIPAGASRHRGVTVMVSELDRELRSLRDPAVTDAPTSKLLDTAKEAMRDHFRQRASEKAAGLVEEWQRERVYPYQGQPETPVEEAERQVFNVVALNVNHFLPNFQESDEKTKRLQLRLLRHAVEHAPADLSKILTEVLELPIEKRQELADLLDRTTLAHIISASKIIADRLEFLQASKLWSSMASSSTLFASVPSSTASSPKTPGCSASNTISRLTTSRSPRC